MSIVETIAGVVQPWSDFYSHSKVTSSAVIGVHVGALLAGGGLAIASDRVVLKLRGADVAERVRALRDISAIHRPIIMALSISVASGLALLFSDVKTFLVSPVYWTKMGLVLLLLANGYGVMRSERRLATDPAPANALWKRLSFGAVASITLWFGTMLAGVVLMND
jgi:hypothetical protein